MVLNALPTIDSPAQTSKPDLMTSADFTLHPQLSADCLALADWPLCRVLRMKDGHYPWLVLVPRRSNMREIIDLSLTDQRLLLEEIGRTCRAVQAAGRVDKLNVAALGNVVPQLHVHVIGRTTADSAWPRPVWGVVPPRPFSDAEATDEIARWQGILARQEP